MTRRRDERGAVAVMVALVSTFLLVLAAMVVDLGLARDTDRQSQNAADASALAAGNVLYTTGGPCLAIPCIPQAVAAAKSYAQTNFGVATSAWNSCTDPAPLAYVPLLEAGSCISFDSARATAQVRVVVPTRTVDTGLGVLAGVSSIDIRTAARATLDPGQLISCGLCVLGTGVHSIGNGDTRDLPHRRRRDPHQRQPGRQPQQRRAGAGRKHHDRGHLRRLRLQSSSDAGAAGSGTRWRGSPSPTTPSSCPRTSPTRAARPAAPGSTAATRSAQHHLQPAARALRVHGHAQPQEQQRAAEPCRRRDAAVHLWNAEPVRARAPREARRAAPSTPRTAEVRIQTGQPPDGRRARRGLRPQPTPRR